MGELIRLHDRRRTVPARSADDARVEPAPSGEPLWREVVGRRLRALRREREERLADTAARAGMSPQYLSELERGLKDPSSEMLAAVAGALGIPLREVIRLAHHDLARRGATRGAGPVLLAA